MIVLIPVVRPDRRLTELVLGLHRSVADPQVVIVDAGSAPGRREALDTARDAGADVIVSPGDRGRGETLRAGLAHVLATYPGTAVVTADADGRHTVDDILCVGTVLERAGQITLGVREPTGDSTLRSRAGRAATALLLRAATGRRVEDVLTGLRGFPAGQLEWLATVGGNRRGYEFAVMLAIAERRLPLVEVPVPHRRGRRR